MIAESDIVHIALPSISSALQSGRGSGGKRTFTEKPNGIDADSVTSRSKRQRSRGRNANVPASATARPAPPSRSSDRNGEIGEILAAVRLPANAVQPHSEEGMVGRIIKLQLRTFHGLNGDESSSRSCTISTPSCGLEDECRRPYALGPLQRFQPSSGRLFDTHQDYDYADGKRIYGATRPPRTALPAISTFLRTKGRMVFRATGIPFTPTRGQRALASRTERPDRSMYVQEHYACQLD